MFSLCAPIKAIDRLKGATNSACHGCRQSHILHAATPALAHVSRIIMARARAARKPVVERPVLQALQAMHSGMAVHSVGLGFDSSPCLAHMYAACELQLDKRPAIPFVPLAAAPPSAARPQPIMHETNCMSSWYSLAGALCVCCADHMAQPVCTYQGYRQVEIGHHQSLP